MMKQLLAIIALGGMLTFSACGTEEQADTENATAEQTMPEEQPTEMEAVQAEMVDGVQTITVKVTDMKYEPAKIALKAGVPAKITFDQHGTTQCAWDMKSEDLGIPLTDLPEGEMTVVEFTPAETGTYTYTCGMDMLKGTVVVEEGTASTEL